MNGMLLIHSAVVGLGAVLLASVLGFLFALTAWGLPPLARRLAYGIALANLLMPPFLTANAWLGWFASCRALQSPEQLAWSNLPITAAAIAGLFWPIPALAAKQSLERIPGVQLEWEPELAGWSLVRWLAWPSVRPSLLALMPLLLVLALSNFTIPTLFQVRVFTEEFWVRFNTQLDPWSAFAAAWPLCLLPLTLAWLPKGRLFQPTLVTQSSHPSMVRRRLGGLMAASAIVVLLWLMFVWFGPMADLLLSRRTWTELPGASAAGISAWRNSLLTSLVPSTLGVGLALVLVAGQSTPQGPRWVWLCFLTPGVFLGVLAIQVFNRYPFFDFYQSMGLPLLVLSIRYWPLAWAAVAAASDPADGLLADAARLAGAGPWHRWRVARLPRLWFPAGTAWLVLVSLCLWDVESVVLVQPPGGETLALRIFNLLHYGHAAQVNSLAVLLLTTALVIAGIGWLLLAWLAPRPAHHQHSKGTGWLVPALLLAIGVSGCGPAAKESTQSIDSQIFRAVQIIGSRGTAPGEFNKPRSLTCDRNDNLYVVDITGRVQKFDPDGKWLLQWQMPETDLGKPKGMGIDPKGNILVVEPHYQRINHFTPMGHLVAQWGRKGIAPGELILPRSIAVTSQGEYLVSEYTVVDRIQRFAVSLPDDRNGLNPLPQPMALSGTNVTVPFRFTGMWGEPGQKPGQFNRAESLAVDASDQVFVADSCNHRIQVFRSDGQFIREYGRAGRQPGEFSYPYDIKIDPEGTQYVCEFGNSRITILDRKDRVLEILGGSEAGAQPGHFANPWSMALNSKGDLYVADSQNHRVQKFLRRARQAEHHSSSATPLALRTSVQRMSPSLAVTP